MTSSSTAGAPYIAPDFAPGGRPELRCLVIWMDGLLAAEVAEGRDGWSRSELISVREEVYALACGGPLTEYGFFCTRVALDYFYRNDILPPDEHLSVSANLEAPDPGAYSCLLDEERTSTVRNS